MERIKDQPFMQFSSRYIAKTTGIDIKCPNCGKKAILKITDNHELVYIKCTACTYSNEKPDCPTSLSASAYCKECLRSFRVEIKDETAASFKILNIPCPHCGKLAPGEVKTKIENYYCTDVINKNGRDIYFDTELYYIESFKGQPVWALNYEHLQYLIEYVQADIREARMHNAYAVKTQDHAMPRFMKLAKNRNGILKILKKMEED